MATPGGTSPRWFPAIIVVNQSGGKPTVEWQAQQGQPSFEASISIAKDALRSIGLSSIRTPAALKKTDGKTRYYIEDGATYKEV